MSGAGEGGRIVVTGGAGFVGTNLASHFASRGVDVLVYDDLSRSGVEQNVRWLTERYPDRVHVEVADIRDERALRAAMRGSGAVLHLASQVAVTTSLVDPTDDFEVNARGTLNVLEALRAEASPPPLIFTSTNKVYGNLADVRLRERETRYEPRADDLTGGVGEGRPLDFHSPYGCSKGCADQYVLDYARVYDIPAAVFRMSCIYGPHQHGTEDQGWVAHFLMRAMAGDPLTIFGDGKQVRDVLYVDDLVDAFERVLDRMDEVRGTAFNVGGGPSNAVSLLELLDVIEDLEGSAVRAAFDRWRAGDQRWYVSDSSRLRDLTGWEPQVGVRDGVARLHAWLRARQDVRPRRPAPVQAASR